MIQIIDWISEERFQAAATEVEQKLGPAQESVELIEIQEGLSVQIMHIGDYSQVQEICNQLYGKFLPKNNISPAEPYHEISLNDPYRTSPEKRRLVIRQPAA